MSGNESVGVRFPDGLVLWSWHWSTSDTTARILQASPSEPHPIGAFPVHAPCGREPEPVELATDDIGWFGTACRACMVIVRHNDPWPTDSEGFSGRPDVRPHDEPAWLRVAREAAWAESERARMLKLQPESEARSV